MNFGSNPQKQTGKNKEVGGGEGNEEESGGEKFIRNKNYDFYNDAIYGRPRM